MIEKARELVSRVLSGNETGHGMDHIDRVYKLAMKFCAQESADAETVALAALLHDVDDYKIVGAEQAKTLANSREIMRELNTPESMQQEILEIIGTMGYSKSLLGIRPQSLEGKIVSDADMCDAVGANGIIRSIVYAVSDKGNGRVFDKNVFPNINITSADYNSYVTTHDTDGAINHFFEKSLKLRDLMLTKSGRAEAEARHEFTVNFLLQLFSEEDAPEWRELLLDNFS